MGNGNEILPFLPASKVIYILPLTCYFTLLLFTGLKPTPVDQKTASLQRSKSDSLPPAYNIWDYIDDDLKFRVRDRLLDPKNLSLGRMIGHGKLPFPVTVC